MQTLKIKTNRRQNAEGLINLTRVRRWYFEPDAQNENPPGGAADGAQQGRIEDLPEWARQHIRELRSEAASRRQALTAEQEAARQREQERLTAEGKWRELAEARAKEVAELQPHRDKAQALEMLIRTGNEARIKQIPEPMRVLIPTSLSPEQLSAWLDTSWSMLQPQRAPQFDAGASGSGPVGSATLSAEELAAARRLGVTPEQYAKYKE